MKFWAEHPNRDFDANLFDDYEKQLVKAYLKANKRNRTIVSLRGDELKLEARNWFRLTEKEIHYKVVLQPILATLPKEISEQVNQQSMIIWQTHTEIIVDAFFPTELLLWLFTMKLLSSSA